MMKLRRVIPVLAILASSACVPTETSAPETSGNRNGGAETSSTSKFLKPKQCMMLFGQSASISGALQIAQGVQNKVKWYGDIVGVYRLANGQYGAVRDYLLEDTIKSTKEGEKSIARQVSFGDYPPSTRCTDGSDLTEYTGQRSQGTKHEGKDLSIAGLVVTGIVKGAEAMQEAANDPSSGGGYTPVSSNDATTADSGANANPAPKGVRQVTFDAPYTVVECNDGRKRKVHHDSYGTCSGDDDIIGGNDCGYEIEQAKNYCEK